MANEYTLADFQRLATDTLKKAVIQTFREASPIMEALTWKQEKALNVTYMRINEVPNVPWRNIGEDFEQVKVKPEPITERPYFIGAKSDIAKEFVVADSLVNQRKLQDQAITKGIAYGFNYSLIKGDPTVDEKGITGLWYRLVNDLASGQTVLGGGWDVSPDSAETNPSKGLLRRIDDLLSRFDDLSNVVLLMNRQMKLALDYAIKDSGFMSTTEDKVGKVYTTYGKGGPRIIDAGYKYDLTTQIITNVEADDGDTLTGGDATSIFAVKIGEPNLAGFYEFPLTTRDVGLLEDNVNYRTVIDWSPGIYMINPRACARLVGLVAA